MILLFSDFTLSAKLGKLLYVLFLLLVEEFSK